MMMILKDNTYRIRIIKELMPYR